MALCKIAHTIVISKAVKKFSSSIVKRSCSFWMYVRYSIVYNKTSSQQQKSDRINNDNNNNSNNTFEMEILSGIMWSIMLSNY